MYQCGHWSYPHAFNGHARTNAYSDSNSETPADFDADSNASPDACINPNYRASAYSHSDAQSDRPSDSYAVFDTTSLYPIGRPQQYTESALQTWLKGRPVQDAVFQLHDTVFLTEDGQEIHTEGFPIDDSRALLRVGHKDIVTAVSSGNKPRVKLRNVIIDGTGQNLELAKVD